MARALLALGSNVGSPGANLNQATSQLVSDYEIQLLARSGWHRTEAVGGPAGQDAFLNGCILVQTVLEPQGLAAAVHEVEQRMGRTREVHWGPRTIDIDLLLYDQQISHDPELTLPHPRMSFRRFVLEPACEVAPQVVHPTSGWTISSLHRHLCRSPRIVAVYGSDAESAQRLAVEVCRRAELQFLDRPNDLSGWSARDFLKRGELTTSVVACFRQGSKFPGQFVPTLTIVWATNEDKLDASPQRVLDRMHWRGPTALLEGTDFDSVADEAVHAVHAAWPEMSRSRKGDGTGSDDSHA